MWWLQPQPVSVCPLAPQTLAAKMKLFLAVAVLMLALVAYTGGIHTSAANTKPVTAPSFLCVTWTCVGSPAEAQDDTLEDKFSRFGDKMTEIGQTVAEKAKTTFENIHNSDAAVSTRYVRVYTRRKRAHICTNVHVHTLTRVFLFLMSSGPGSRRGFSRWRTRFSRSRWRDGVCSLQPTNTPPHTLIYTHSHTRIHTYHSHHPPDQQQREKYHK